MVLCSASGATDLVPRAILELFAAMCAAGGGGTGSGDALSAMLQADVDFDIVKRMDQRAYQRTSRGVTSRCIEVRSNIGTCCSLSSFCFHLVHGALRTQPCPRNSVCTRNRVLECVDFIVCAQRKFHVYCGPVLMREGLPC